MAAKCSLAHVIVIVLCGWLASLVILSISLWDHRTNDASSTISPALENRLANAVTELNTLQRQNLHLKQLINQIISQDKVNPAESSNLQQELKLIASRGNGPGEGYEVARRQVLDDIREFWFYVGAQLKIIRQKVEGQKELDHLIEDAGFNVLEHYKATVMDMTNLTLADGLEEQRKQRNILLIDTIQQRLYKLQNPDDCSQARKLVCNLNKGCGFGCQVHHATYCLIVAYATGRTMILKSQGWRYNRRGWEEVFLPVSNTCTDPSGRSRMPWPGRPETQVLDIPIVDSLNPRPSYLPPAIPRDLASQLLEAHGNPIVWWISQFVRYLMRPQPATEEMLNQAKKDMGFSNPIVGIHIRRTDKVGTEAAFHPLSEYMFWVDLWYDIKEMETGTTISPRKVFIASDDPSVISDAKKKYPHYVVVGDPNISKTAGVGTRYSESSLRGIIIDISLLAQCDYLVCTFSSQVCRVSYEIMQSLHPDASSWFKSLDDVYYFGGQNAHNQIARLHHKARKSEEIDLRPGDLVGIAGNHWDGFSKGQNKRTKRTGLYPSFKVKEKIEIVDFPYWSET